MGAKPTTIGGSGSTTTQQSPVRVRALFSTSSSSSDVVVTTPTTGGSAPGTASGGAGGVNSFRLLRASGDGGGGGGVSDRQRARSLSSVPDLRDGTPGGPNSSSNGSRHITSTSHHHHNNHHITSYVQPHQLVTVDGMSSLPTGFDVAASVDSTAEDAAATATTAAAAAAAASIALGRVYAAHSLPSHIWSLNGIKCPVCSKFIVPDDIECHLVMCLTKPRLSYNEDVLTDDKGECVICLDDLSQGDVIARLPCLCIYHKGCIDQWFEINRSCPEHPGTNFASAVSESKHSAGASPQAEAAGNAHTLIPS